MTQEPHRPYERPPLSKTYLRDEAGLERVYLQDEGYDEEHGIERIQGVAATALDTDARRGELDDGHVLGYEKLLLATGTLAGVPVFHGVLGGVTQLLMTYTVTRMYWIERLPPEQPLWLMRTTLFL